MTLEAEDHRWTNFQLESYFALVNAGYSNLGTVLQTRLFRTEKDLDRFDQRMRVRLVTVSTMNRLKLLTPIKS